MNRTLFSIVLLVILLIAGTSSKADDATDNIASMITKLPAFISFPDGRASEGNDDLFVISVVGDSPLLAKLKEFHKKQTKDGKSIKVRKVPPDLIPSNSHILLILSTDAAQVKSIVAQVKGTSTITICSAPDLGGKGSVLNIYGDSSGKVVVEIDATVAKAENLTIKPPFLKIARVLNAEK